MDNATMLFVASQLISVVVIIFSNKTDIKLITNILDRQDNRITKLEESR